MKQNGGDYIRREKILLLKISLLTLLGGVGVEEVHGVVDDELGGVVVELVYDVLEMELLVDGVEVVHGVLELGGGGGEDETDDDSVQGVVVEVELKLE